MGTFDKILFPLKWAVAYIMVGAQKVFSFFGMSPDSGWTWVASIVALTVFIRVLLIPLFVRQIKASRGMQIVQPEIQKLQKKYKGRTDTASRQAMQAEMMAIYREAGTSPFASCMPMLLQMPIFFALFRVLIALKDIADGTYVRPQGIGPLTPELAQQIHGAKLLGDATLADTFLGSDVISVKVIAAVLVVLMSASMLFTQRQLTMKNMPASALDNPMARQQKILMYILPGVFVVSGVSFPIGVLIYWTTSNIWSMGQQWWVIRNNPTPGSEAERMLLERRARKAERKGLVLDDAGKAVDPAEIPEPPAPPTGQRQQPRRKPRRKR